MKVNREHFSWSQYDLWHRSKREYWKRYSVGSEQKSNRFFDKGKELATFIETGEIIGRSDDGMLKLVVEQMPKLEIPEAEIRFHLYTNVGNSEVLCYLDSMSSGADKFLEYKTGKIPWTQEKVDEAEQLVFYATAIYDKYGIIPNAQLVWVETMDTENDGLLYTGVVKTFNRDFTMRELQEMYSKIQNTINEIAEFEYEELEIDNDDVNRYIYLQKVIEEAELELSAIKMKVQSELMEKDVKFGKGLRGNFIITERKTWNYTEVVEELKKDIAKQQKLEQKNGTATFSVGQSIMFKAVKN